MQVAGRPAEADFRRGGMIAPMNLADELSRQANVTPDAVAVHFPGGAWTFARFDLTVWQVATLLKRNDINRGDVVALSFKSELNLLATLLAVARIGAIAFSLPRHAPKHFRMEMAARAQVSAFATDTETGDADQPRLLIDTHVLEGFQVDPDVREIVNHAPWLIISGSGSTGHPKLFAVTHEQFLARTRLAAAMLGLSASDRLASLSHSDFTSPKERYLAALFAGAAVVLFDRSRNDVPALIRDQGVTVLDATVFHVEQMLVRLPAKARRHLGDLRALQLSASTVSDGLRRRIVEQLTPALYVRYGTNETGPLASVGPAEVLNVPGSVGHPPDGVRIDIADADDQPLQVGAKGLIRVQTPGLIDRYLRDDEATALAFRGGWFYPGDLGSITTNGQLVFHGRADHMMIMNGVNIYPAEIERVISGHPAVSDTASVPLRSALHQDIPICAVTLRPGFSTSENQLLDYACRHLGSHAPRNLFVLGHIPRNEQGKLIRPLLLQSLTQKLRKSRGLKQTSAMPIKLGQPSRLLHIRFQDNAALDPAEIDNWLTVYLRAKSEPCRSQAGLPDGSPAGRRIALTWSILLLMRELMQAARIPIFDPGCIISIEPDRTTPSAWVAWVAMAKIDHLPSPAYTTAAQGVCSIMQWLAGKPLTQDNAFALFAMIANQILPRLRSFFSSGKSSLHVLRAAHALDIPFLHLGGGVFQLGWGSRSRKLDRSTSDADSAIGAKIAQNKVWSANLIRRAGLPAPRHIAVSSEGEIRHAARSLGWPLVVKPIDRDRGEGISVGIDNEDKLLAAFKFARRLSKSRQIIVEREVRGVCHRLFVAKGRLLYAVKRLPKSVHGDGKLTVAELIDAANQKEKLLPPWFRSEPYPADNQAVAALAAAGFSLESVPAAGERVPLRQIESTATGGFDEEVTGRIHADNLDIAIRAAALFDLEIAGIDIITPDISRPWHENGAIINEVNYAPLLGGGEISRSYIPDFLARLVASDGRIPIEAYLGNDDAFLAARARQIQLANSRVACFLTSHATTLGPEGTDLPVPGAGLYARCQALLMNRRVEAIVLVIQTDELLQTGLPVDRLTRYSVAGGTLLQAAFRNGHARMHALLGQYLQPSAG